MKLRDEPLNETTRFRTTQAAHREMIQFSAAIQAMQAMRRRAASNPREPLERRTFWPTLRSFDIGVAGGGPCGGSRSALLLPSAAPPTAISSVWRMSSGESVLSLVFFIGGPSSACWASSATTSIRVCACNVQMHAHGRTWLMCLPVGTPQPCSSEHTDMPTHERTDARTHARRSVLTDGRDLLRTVYGLRLREDSRERLRRLLQQRRRRLPRDRSRRFYRELPRGRHVPEGAESDCHPPARHSPATRRITYCISDSVGYL